MPSIAPNFFKTGTFWGKRLSVHPELISFIICIALLAPTLITHKETNYFFNQGVLLAIIFLAVAGLILFCLSPILTYDRVSLGMLVIIFLLVINCTIHGLLIYNQALICFLIVLLIVYLLGRQNAGATQYPRWATHLFQLLISFHVVFAMLKKNPGDAGFLSGFDNPNLLSQYLVALSIFSFLNLRFKRDVRPMLFWSMINLVSVLFIITYNGSRASILGFLVLFFLIVPIFPDRWKLTKFALPAILICFFLLGIAFKRDSSIGRMLIYKVSLSAFSEASYLGQGLNLFPRFYNLQQIEYFRTGGDNREKILADSVNFAYNEFLQIACELGGIFLIVILIVIVWVYRGISQAMKKNPNDALTLSNLSILVLMLIYSLTNFPLHSYSFMAVFFVITIFNKGSKVKFITNAFFVSSLFKVLTLIVVIRGMVALYYTFEYKRIYTSLPFNVHESLILLPHMDSNEYYLFNIAQKLSLSGNYISSNLLLDKLMLLKVSQGILDLYGNNLVSLNKFPDAQRIFEMMNYNVPGKILPKYKLLIISDVLEQKEKALKWAQEIVLTPVKIKSSTGDSLRSYATNYLIQHKKNRK